MRKIMFFLALFVAVAGLNASSQQQLSQLPLDPKVKKGVLPNGLTYYIQHNATPKKQAEFFIAQKVGSMQEDETQLGLAHFLEHMAFNGTKNFPGNTLIKYLETIGVRFGSNLNAYTSFDETVYNISNVPITRSSIVDSALLILHDWSGFISLDGDEIDKERGVIREEWRSRNSGAWRVFESVFKTINSNDLIGRRIPIGSMDIINSFPHEHIRSYYKKWYRPDLQAIIVVGDIDVNAVEARIKTLFSDIPKPVNPAVRTYASIKNNSEPIIAIATDPEVTKTDLSVYYKQDATPFSECNSMSYYQRQLILKLIKRMMNKRFTEIIRLPDSPFQAARTSYEPFFGSVAKDAWCVNSSVKNGESLNSFRHIIRENYRMQRFGFNASELERVKKDLLSDSENEYNDRERQTHISFVNSYVKNFLSGTPAAGIEFDYKTAKEFFSKLTVEEVNKVARLLVTENNMVITITGPQKSDIKIPAVTDIVAALNEAKKEEIAAYEDKVLTKPLLASIPKRGKIVKEEKSEFGYTKWTLSNGAKVYLKNTDFKKDQILMRCVSEGGTSLLPISDKANYSIINDVIQQGGIGDFNPSELENLLSGKFVGVQSIVSAYSEQISGYSSPKDFETLMQLAYLQFTQPRKDEAAFKNLIAKKRNQIINANLKPETAFYETILDTLFNKHPFVKRYNLDLLEKADYNRILEIYRDRFSNAADFSFIFSGNVDIQAARKAVETYIGSLPGRSGTEKWKDMGLRYQKGKRRIDMDGGRQSQKSSIFVSYSGKAKYSQENSVLLQFIKSVLNFRYTEEIREKEGGSYGITVAGIVDNKPTEVFEIQISFTTDPKLTEKMLGIVHREIEKLVENGPSLADIAKIKEFSLKSYEENLISNGYWLTCMQEYLNDSIDNSKYADIVKKITPEMVKNAAKEWLTQGNVVEAVMSPKAEK